MAKSIGHRDKSIVNLVIYADGKQIDATYGISYVCIRKTINRIASATIQITDQDLAGQDFPISNKNDFKPGVKIKVEAGYGSEKSEVFSGVVVKHGVGFDKYKGAKLSLECKDLALAMTLRNKSSEFSSKTDSDIITALIKNNSLAAEVKSTTFVHDEFIQFNCTDWDLMLIRADVNGYIVNADAGKVSVHPPNISDSPVYKIGYGQDILSFNLEMDSCSQLKSVQAISWDQTQQKINEVKAENPNVPKQGNIDSATLSKVFGIDDYSLQSGAEVAQADLKNWVNAKLQKSWMSRISGSITVEGEAGLVPDSLIELNGVGDRFTGNAYISSITHSFDTDGWTSEIGVGLSADWFSETNRIGGPDASGLLPSINGLQIGKVTKIDSDPNGEAMIQVAIPIIKSESEGIWARMASFYSSSSIGAFFPPEIDDEVVVGFFNNDPRFPVVLGSLYSSKNTPPYEFSEKNSKKGIITKEKLKLEFNEEEKSISLITPGGNKIVINDDSKSLLMQDQNGNEVKLSDTGISLESSNDIKINAGGKLSIQATGAIDLNSTADFSLSALNVNQEAQVAFQAKGNASAGFEASGETTIKGAIVMIN